MKTSGAPRWYVSGPHSGDYYLLLDEQSDRIFDRRVAGHICGAGGACDGRTGLATAGLLEMWIDDADKAVWYLFEARRGDEP